MPPRREEETMMVASRAQHRPTNAGVVAGIPVVSPASRPSLIDLPKDISFLDIQNNHLPGSSNSSCANDMVRQRMTSSLERASQRVQEIYKRLERPEFKAKSPVLYEACRSALVEEMSRKLDQSRLLLEETKKEDPDVSLMTKNKRLSVSLVNALQYLDNLESAMAFSSRDRLEDGLLSVLKSIAAKSNQDDDGLLDTLLMTDNSALNVCVSSWMAPSLAFDFRVGSTAAVSIQGNSKSSLPLDLEVRPIIEYMAEELVLQGAPSKKKLEAEAFAVKVIKCKHELREYGARDGITGEAMVQVHIAPLAETKSKRKETVWKGGSDEVEKIRVKEVRATQQNAYPTKFTINFDMFTSSVYGESGLTLTLNLETCQTMDGKVPIVQIELVVDP